MSSSSLDLGLIGRPLADPARTTTGRMLVLYGQLLGPLLAGYMLFDKAFAYIHVPGTPVYVGEMTLVVGGLGVLGATGYLRIPVRDEPILALLGAFFLWGLIRFLPGLRDNGIEAIRDFALVYYCLFAFFTVAALARSPDLPDRWLANFNRLVPWLLIWLPVELILQTKLNGPHVPFSDVPILTHASGNAAFAALIALGFLLLFPEKRSAFSRAVLSILALIVIALAATQNRGGLVGVAAGAVVGLAFLPARDRLRLVVRAVAVIVVGLGLAAGLSLKVPTGGRTFSVPQLIENVASIGGGGSSSSSGLQGTVEGRDQLWTLLYHLQVSEGRLDDGFGFGVNLPYLVNDTQVGSGSDPLRSPHNSHDDVLARMGLVGFVLWLAMWLGWYWRMIVGAWRLKRHGVDTRRKIVVLCLMGNTAMLVSSFFAPLLEGAQVAVLLWVLFGLGVVMTTRRGWYRPQAPALAAPARRKQVALFQVQGTSDS